MVEILETRNWNSTNFQIVSPNWKMAKTIIWDKKNQFSEIVRASFAERENNPQMWHLIWLNVPEDMFL